MGGWEGLWGTWGLRFRRDAGRVYVADDGASDVYNNCTMGSGG